MASTVTEPVEGGGPTHELTNSALDHSAVVDKNVPAAVNLNTVKEMFDSATMLRYENQEENPFKGNKQLQRTKNRDFFTSRSRDVYSREKRIDPLPTLNEDPEINVRKSMAQESGTQRSLYEEG